MTSARKLPGRWGWVLNLFRSQKTWIWGPNCVLSPLLHDFFALKWKKYTFLWVSGPKCSVRQWSHCTRDVDRFQTHFGLGEHEYEVQNEFRARYYMKFSLWSEKNYTFLWVSGPKCSTRQWSHCMRGEDWFQIHFGLGEHESEVQNEFRARYYMKFSL